jgi:hypothetical protein
MAENINHIDEQFPEVKKLHLKVRVGACRIKISPGEGETWVSGTSMDPQDALPLKIEREGEMLRITQEYWRGE